MKGAAKAPKKMVASLHDRCETLNLKAESERDQEMLATIYRTLFGLNQTGDKFIAVIDPTQPGMIGRWMPNG